MIQIHTHTQSSHMTLATNPPVDAGDIRDLGSTPESGRSPGGGPHSSILAWRIPQTEEPCRLRSIGSQSWTRLRRLSTYTHTYTHIHICVCICILLLFSHKVVSYSFATPWTVACQSPLLMGFPRHEDWSELAFPPPGIFSTQGLIPHLLHRQVEFVPLSIYIYIYILFHYSLP